MKNSYKVIVDINLPTRFELSGKRYVIFKNFAINKTNWSVNISSKKWLMSEWIEDKNSAVVTEGEILSFETLQQAFNHAEKLKLEFL